MAASEQQVCVRCVMDRGDPDIRFDASGVCNWCRQWDELSKGELFTAEGRERALETQLAEMKRRGRGKRYDCVVGLSGGVDSSYAAYTAKKLGLRPLAVHLDNGWNSELAVMNIENILRKLDVDLYTHVIEWPVFRDLQLAMFRASVVDIEILTDHAIIAALYAVARKFRIPYIVTGDNHATEATLPRTWNHRKTDLVNIRAIHRAHGTNGFQTFPQLGTLAMLFHQRVLGIKFVPILSYVPYVKADAIRTMERELGWRPYGGKHYESIFTRFYQGYILPTKFGIDKRKLHLSRLVCSGQITRDEALATLATSPYDPDLLVLDRQFVLKKLGLSEDEFDRIMREKPRSHYDYASDESALQFALSVNRKIREAKRVVTSKLSSSSNA